MGNVEYAECYAELANAIVLQAFKDYRKALFKLVQEPEEKRRGLQAVMAHYSGSREPLEFPDAMMNRVAILKLEAENLTGKQHK